jgi:hypothetical protein
MLDDNYNLFLIDTDGMSSTIKEECTYTEDVSNILFNV